MGSTNDKKRKMNDWDVSDKYSNIIQFVASMNSMQDNRSDSPLRVIRL